jgi:hypothetical protein
VTVRPDPVIEAARAVPLADVIATRGLRLRRSGTEFVGPCMLCGGQDRFAINPRRGLWLCRHCGQGGNDAISLTRFLDGCTFAAAVATLSGTAPMTNTKPAWKPLEDARIVDHRPLARSPPCHDDDRKDDAHRIARAREIWHGALPAAGSPVVRYLASRGIDMPPPPTLRWAPRCWHGEARQWFPAMVALVQHFERGIVGIHRTYLRNDGSGKADLPKNWQRRTLGPVGGGAVRLSMPRKGEWFAVAEGVETLLSVTEACFMPGWAALSAGGVRRLILPAEATHLVICVDNDGNGVGQRDSYEAAQQWLAEGRRVRVAVPPEMDSDFNTVLTAAGDAKTEMPHVA